MQPQDAHQLRAIEQDGGVFEIDRKGWDGLNLSTALRQWPISNYRGDWFSHDRKEFWGLSGTDHHAIVGGGGQMIVKPEAGRVRFIHKGDPFLWEVVSDK
jgi:hypothetical protein